jgi:formate hydrogenlyase subunit 3/multisubunit Na+/H+ antiporter MnhD subunit
VRFGAIPAHQWAARLTDAVPETTLPLVTAIAPAALAIVALAWADGSITPLALDLTSVRFVVLAVAIASIFLASLAAFIQDDIEHVVGYAIVGDAGVVMLAVAALDPAAWAPARIWILAFVVARSAFAAWAAATRATFGTGHVAELRGWAVRAPLLAVVLGLVVVASIGLPGLAAAEARGQLIALVLDGPVAVVVMLGTLSPLLYYGRLFGTGIDRGGGVERVGWRPVLDRVDLTDVRASVRRAWADNRLVAATACAGALAILALVVSAGAFGGPQAAAGLPPVVGGVVESFTPAEPEAAESDAPSAAPAPVEASPAPSPEPSFAPVPAS